MRRLTFTLAALTAVLASALAQEPPRLIRNPALSADKIIFEFGTDLWTVPRTGGRATRLTVGAGIEALPVVSPDGSTVAFEAGYDGNTDIYVVQTVGGQPKRLTFHPGLDSPVGWTQDGQSVLYESAMDQPSSNPRLYTVPKTGGWPKALPLPRGTAGSYSPDGSQIAYIPNDLWQPDWKRYRGGQTTPIWIARLSDSKIEKIPRDNSNDRYPVWVGDTVYFLSDRTGGRWTLYAYDTKSKKVSQLLAPGLMDIKSIAGGPGGLVISRMGAISIYDYATKTEHPVSITIADDFAELRPQIRSVADAISNFSLSPSGVRVAVEARGEVFSVPVEKGDARNLTQTPGTAERMPIWSPDGKKIAYLSDASGNYKLHIADQADGGHVEAIDLGEKPDWYRSIQWSPDSKKILFIDQSLNLGYYDLEKKKAVRFDRAPYYYFGESMTPSWSPDSKWITYAKQGVNKLHSVLVYNLEEAKSQAISDGLSNAISPVFDRGGKQLFFAASTDFAQAVSLGGMSGFGADPSFQVYVVNLRAADASPFEPQSDEEPSADASKPPEAKPAEAKPDEKLAPPKPADVKPEAKPSGPEVKIDFEAIGQRILSVPGVGGKVSGLLAGTPGNLLIQDGQSIIRYSISDRKPTPLGLGTLVTTTPSGDKALITGPGGIQVVSTMAPSAPGQGTVQLDGLQSVVDRKAEWRQMFNEIWRNYRDFFYDPNLHGLDIEKVKARYSPFLEGLTSRQDFNYLKLDMMNEVVVGHTFSGGGDLPAFTQVPGGLLGADYAIENGRFRFAKIFNGENWNPGLRAPLTQPGATVKAGEYLIAINGKPITDQDDVFERMEGTANRQTKITVSANPDGKDSRTITVVPVATERRLRYLDWVESNRRKVAELSGGRISYVYIPDTGGGGFASFNRYFTAQLGKDAVLVDDRFNQGGALADYVVQVLTRKVLVQINQRDNTDVPVPAFAIEGPKAMLINEMAGSGGDAMPWFFRIAKVGTLIGTRTWGGLVAASEGVPLMGGGFATAPQNALYGLNGSWDVENHGVAPDIMVEEDPFLWRKGHDPQLEAAVKHLLVELAKNPPKVYKRPEYKNYHKDSGLGKTIKP